VKDSLKTLLAAASLIVLAGCGQKVEQAGPAAQSGPALQWKMQSYWQSGTLPQQLFEGFARRVEALSGSRIKVEAMPTNAVVAPPEALDAVGAGVLDG